jgi:hypothetical protein
MRKHGYVCYPEEFASTSFQWAGPAGFGNIIFTEKDGVVYCDGEKMTKTFIKKRLCEMVNKCKLKG